MIEADAGAGVALRADPVYLLEGIHYLALYARGSGTTWFTRTISAAGDASVPLAVLPEHAR